MCCDTTVGSHWPLSGLSEIYTSYQITAELTGLAKFNGLRSCLSTTFKDWVPDIRAGPRGRFGWSSGELSCPPGVMQKVNKETGLSSSTPLPHYHHQSALLSRCLYDLLILQIKAIPLKGICYPGFLESSYSQSRWGLDLFKLQKNWRGCNWREFQ